MNQRAIKDLINDIEKTFREYYDLLKPLVKGETQHTIQNQHELIGFLATLKAIEGEIIEYRLEKILKEEHPYLTSINPGDIKKKSTNDFNLKQIVTEYLTQKKDLVKLLYGTPADYWERTGVLSEEGHITFYELAQRFLEKDRNSLIDLKKKLNQNSDMN